MSWTEKLHALNHSDLEHEMALSSMEIPSPDAPITYGLSKSELIELHSSAHHERRNLDRDTDIWLSDSEGVPLSSEREHLFRVADTGNEICNIKTLDEAKASKFWPLTVYERSNGGRDPREDGERELGAGAATPH